MRFVLIGRVALVNYSKDYGRLIVIVDVVDQNRLHCSVYTYTTATWYIPKNVEDTVHREVEIVQHLSGHPAVVTLKAVCGGCKSKQLKGTRRLGVRDYISLLSFIFCPKYKDHGILHDGSKETTWGGDAGHQYTEGAAFCRGVGFDAEHRRRCHCPCTTHQIQPRARASCVRSPRYGAQSLQLQLNVGVVYKFACDVLANQDFVEAFLRGQGRRQ
ncbi:uncharacterized protein [Triticum aestivum]|uniref:uncharacterized protein isoform X2 n=1 Tax=Triticum aestivum TaxID=4565 RepID=UPI001D02A8A8|nr:uncharacterized protein LOC123064890 isoform X2 [Triticum aestivum]